MLLLKRGCLWTKLFLYLVLKSHLKISLLKHKFSKWNLLISTKYFYTLLFTGLERKLKSYQRIYSEFPSEYEQVTKPSNSTLVPISILFIKQPLFLLWKKTGLLHSCHFIELHLSFDWYSGLHNVTNSALEYFKFCIAIVASHWIWIVN